MFTIQSCVDRGCEKVVKTNNITIANTNLSLRKCSAYAKPAVLMCHRHGDPCPLGPYQGKATKTFRINPLKASKRKLG